MATEKELIVWCEVHARETLPPQPQRRRMTFDEAFQRLTEAMEITRADLAMALMLGKPVIVAEGIDKRTD